MKNTPRILAVVLAAFSPAGCYHPVVVQRPAPPSRVQLIEGRQIGIGLDQITSEFEYTIITITAENKTGAEIGYFEVVCRQFDASGRQIDRNYSNDLQLDPHARQQMDRIYLVQSGDARLIKCGAKVGQ